MRGKSKRGGISPAPWSPCNPHMVVLAGGFGDPHMRAFSPWCYFPLSQRPQEINGPITHISQKKKQHELTYRNICKILNHKKMQMSMVFSTWISNNLFPKGWKPMLGDVPWSQLLLLPQVGWAVKSLSCQWALLSWEEECPWYKFRHSEACKAKLQSLLFLHQLQPRLNPAPP